MLWFLQDDLTLSMLEKCKQSLPVVQRIIESTSDDEVMLFDALSLHDELQLIISRHGELAAASEPGQQMSNNTEETSGDSKTDKATLPPLRGSTTEMADYSEVRSTDSNKPSHQEESADKSS